MLSTASKLHHSHILVCKCRFIVRRRSNEPLLWEPAVLSTQPLNLYKGHDRQSGITLENLKVSPMLDLAATAAAMTLFWSYGQNQPIGKEGSQAVAFCCEALFWQQRALLHHCQNRKLRHLKCSISFYCIKPSSVNW